MEMKFDVFLKTFSALEMQFELMMFRQLKPKENSSVK